jgi:hypothetical protein
LRDLPRTKASSNAQRGRASGVEQLPAILVQEIESRDALSREQILDAVRMPDPLLQQYRVFSACPPTIASVLVRRQRLGPKTGSK